MKEMNECVGDKVEKKGRKMSVKNSAMTRTYREGGGRGRVQQTAIDCPHQNMCQKNEY